MNCCYISHEDDRKFIFKFVTGSSFLDNYIFVCADCAVAYRSYLKHFIEIPESQYTVERVIVQ